MRGLWNSVLQRTGQPKFAMSTKDVTLITDPLQYYEEILSGIQQSKSTIVLSSLYLGTGDKEKVLIDAIEKQLSNHSNLEVGFLLDFYRGHREGPGGESSVSMIEKLLQKYPTRVRGYFYQSPYYPQLTKLLKGNLKEATSVYHGKFLLFDDKMMIGGANLSHDYFTNRIDRNMILYDQYELQNYYHTTLFPYLSQQCYQYHGNQQWTPPLPYNPLPTHSQEGIIGKGDMIYIPLLSDPYRHVDQSYDMMKGILSILPSTHHTTISTAYCNFASEIEEILMSCGYPMDIIIPAKASHGWYKAKGMSRWIVLGYERLEAQFQWRIAQYKREGISFYHYNQPEQVYHAKGLWVRDEEGNPYVTMIGSNNYGKRSKDRDIELDALCLPFDIESPQGFQELLSVEMKGIYEGLQKQPLQVKETPQWDRLGVLLRIFQSYL